MVPARPGLNPVLMARLATLYSNTAKSPLARLIEHNRGSREKSSGPTLRAQPGPTIRSGWWDVVAAQRGRVDVRRDGH